MKESAGTLLWRNRNGVVEVLIVHPGGAYNRRAPWSIPKGLPDPGEPLEAAARRETREEACVDYAGPLVPLGHMTYTKSRKRIHCFAGEAPPGADPRCGSWEVDRAEFVPIAKARELLHPEQIVFLDRLESLLI
jgi:predicted NUDIX family NTP pyrophosphohydrolase